MNTNKPQKNILSLDAILLLAMATAHFWFNQVSSAFLVTLLAIYVLLDLIHPQMADEIPNPKKRHKFLFLTKLGIVLFSLMFAAILPAGFNIIQRQMNEPTSFATDGLIQTEVAIEFLLEGKNPYTEDYTNTLLADWQGGEPPFTPVPGPLYHNVYLPFLFIASIPAYLLSQAFLGWYDQRFVFLLFYLGTLLLLPAIVKKQRQQLILMCLVGLNFLFTYFLAEGRNDVVILFGLVLCTAFLAHGYNKSSAFVLGLTLMVKHQAWFFLPFYLLYTLPKPINLASIKKWLISLWPLYVAVAVVLIPFLIWDFSSFIADTVFYITGQSEYSFPIRGIGLSHIMVAIGIIPSLEAPFPFLILSLGFGLPVLAYTLRRQYKTNSLANMWLGFALFGFTFQYFSRFFNDNYMIFLVQALFIAQFVNKSVSAAEESKVAS